MAVNPDFRDLFAALNDVNASSQTTQFCGRGFRHARAGGHPEKFSTSLELCLLDSRIRGNDVSLTITKPT